MKLRDVHAHSLVKSSDLSGFYIEHAISPQQVVTVLNRAKVSFVLAGAHGLSGWIGKPRATEDVDVIVASRHHKKAVKALLVAFTQMLAEDLPVVTRLRHRETQEVAIDVMKPNQQLFREIFKHTHDVRSHGLSYRIPSLEMALAMKFAPMVSLYRRDIDKYQDAHDFGYMVTTNLNIDVKKLSELGDLVYPGGGKEIVDKVEQVRRGETLKL